MPITVVLLFDCSVPVIIRLLAITETTVSITVRVIINDVYRFFRATRRGSACATAGMVTAKHSFFLMR